LLVDVYSSRACAIGPDYKRPQVRRRPGFKEDNGGAQRDRGCLRQGAVVEHFHDDVLNGLEEQIDTGISNVQSAAAEVE